MFGFDLSTRVLDQSGRFDAIGEWEGGPEGRYVLVGTLGGPFHWSLIPARVSQLGSLGKAAPKVRLLTRSGRELVGGIHQRVMTQNGLVCMGDIVTDKHRQDRLALLGKTPAFDAFAARGRVGDAGLIKAHVGDDLNTWFGLAERTMKDLIVTYMFEVNKGGSDRKSTLRVGGSVETLRVLQSLLLHFGVDSGFQVNTDGREVALGIKKGDQVAAERLMGLNGGVVPHEAWKRLCFSIDSYAIEPTSDRLPIRLGEADMKQLVADIARCNADPRVGELDVYKPTKGMASVNLERLRRLDVLTGGLDAWRHWWRDDWFWDSVVSRTIEESHGSLGTAVVTGMPLTVVGDVIVEVGGGWT